MLALTLMTSRSSRWKSNAREGLRAQRFGQAVVTAAASTEFCAQRAMTTRRWCACSNPGRAPAAAHLVGMPRWSEAPDGGEMRGAGSQR